MAALSYQPKTRKPSAQRRREVLEYAARQGGDIDALAKVFGDGESDAAGAPSRLSAIENQHSPAASVSPQGPASRALPKRDVWQALRGAALAPELAIADGVLAAVVSPLQPRDTSRAAEPNAAALQAAAELAAGDAGASAKLAGLEHRRRRQKNTSKRDFVAREMQRVRRRERQQVKLRARLFEEHKERCKKLGVKPGDLTVVPKELWELARWAVCDTSGDGVRQLLSSAPNSVGKAIAVHVALDIREDRRARRDWSSRRARRTVVLACAKLWLAKPSKTVDSYGGGEVIGVPQSCFQELLRDVHDRTDGAVPSLTAIYGTHRVNGSNEGGNVGYWVALRQAGFGYRRQLPVREAKPIERFGKYATNRYKLVSARALSYARRTPHASAVRELYAALPGLVAAIVNRWEHTLGLWQRPPPATA